MMMMMMVSTADRLSKESKTISKASPSLVSPLQGDVGRGEDVCLGFLFFIFFFSSFASGARCLSPFVIQSGCLSVTLLLFPPLASFV